MTNTAIALVSVIIGFNMLAQDAKSVPIALAFYDAVEPATEKVGAVLPEGLINETLSAASGGLYQTGHPVAIRLGAVIDGFKLDPRAAAAEIGNTSHDALREVGTLITAELTAGARAADRR